MSAEVYFQCAITTLQRVWSTQSEAIRKAADMMAHVIADDGAIYAFGASHSFIIAEELVYRTGGLMLVNPIYPQGMHLMVRPAPLTSRLERLPNLGTELIAASPIRSGDLLIIASTSGRNPVVVDAALAARDLGVQIVGITSFAYTQHVSSRHSSGKKLVDLCDVAIDNGAPAGDAVVEVPGFPQKVSPLSTVTGCAIVNALVAETVALLVARGIEPPVFISANLDGGDEHNARLLAANRHRIHYLD